MKPRRPALPGAGRAIGALVAGVSLVAALCLAGALAAFWVHVAHAQSGDEAKAPSNLTAAIGDGGVILNWSSPVQDAASVTGYEILRRRSREGEGSLLVLVSDTGSTATTYVDATANEPGVRYVYRVKALRGNEKSSRSNVARVDLPEEDDETEPTPGPAQRDGAQADTCPDPAPMPTAADVTAVPIVVSSTVDDYFVLYVIHDVDGTEVELPVLVKRGEAGTTTLAENVAALPAERYRVEQYLIADPADVDGDCVDDITELGDPVGMNPANPAPAIELNDGAVVVPDTQTYDALAVGGYFKFGLIGMHTDRPSAYFINAKTHPTHQTFLDDRSINRQQVILGTIAYNQRLVAPDGSQGVYRYSLNTLPTRYSFSFGLMERAHTLLAASMPLLEDNLALHVRNHELPHIQSDLPLYRESRINLMFDGDVYSNINFLALNPGEGYGRLQVLDPDDWPHSRDVVIYEALPNELPRVAGIISTVPQTPLSHVNLRAIQDGVPNAYIPDALEDGDMNTLIGGYVRYTVEASGYSIRAATQAEVDDHYASSRPQESQTPERDLSVTEITPLNEIGFDDWRAFGVKAANVAVLGTLEFPEGTVPDGFAIPFHFYDEFMKAHGFYDAITEMLADEDFQTDFDTQEDMLDDLRDDIEDADSPQWIVDALTALHATYPVGQSLRYRSSTNNEDLPGFNGAGLYDSKTQDQEETEEDGIDKSLKGVFASLWTFRAFTEREFHRIDHSAAAMGVLVHPNYQDELANGVAVSFDPIYGQNPIYGQDDRYYVNTQVGEDLVTNPEVHSIPEEILLRRDHGTYIVLSTSNLVEPGELLMSDAQLTQLRDYLTVIHDHFKGLYDPATGEPFAMEIEFKITSEDVLAIKQARPWVFSGAGTVPPGKTRPSGPVNLVVAPGETSLTVVWDPPADTGGEDPTGYDVRYIRTSADETDDANWTERLRAWTQGSGARSYTITGLETDVPYDVQVRAENSVGQGPWSATATGTTRAGDVPVTLRWEQTTHAVGEDAGSVALKAVVTTTQNRAPATGFSFAFTVATADGTATQPGDYGVRSEMGTFYGSDFSAVDVTGEQRYRAEREFTFTINDDTDDETDEDFAVTLAYATPALPYLEGGNPVATITIRDDEHVPVSLGWLDTSVLVSEGAGTVTLNAAATTMVDKRPETGFFFQASVSTSPDSAASSDDYTDISTTVIFRDNDSWSAIGSGADRRYRATERVTVPVINDTADERDEDFTATVAYVDSNPLHLQGGPATATVTIEDNDLPRVSVETLTATADEDQTLRFTLTREGVTDDPLTVNVRVTETRQMLGSGQPATATFDAGFSTTPLEVALTDDTEDEDNSVVKVTVRSGSGYSVGASASATATALDDDYVPVTLSWDRTSVTVAERAGAVTLRVVATTAKDKRPESGFTSFGARASFTAGTATQGDDYSGQSLTTTFNRSDFTRTLVNGRYVYRATHDFTVDIVSDNDDEADETFAATLAYSGSDQPHLRLGDDTITVTITDTDEPLVTVTANDSTVTEAEPSLTFALRRDGDAASPLRVNVRVTEAGGSMLARDGSYTVNFAAGSNDASLQVNLVNDTEDEDNSAIAVEVVNGSGYFPGSPRFAGTHVTDDDHVSVTLEWEETAETVGESGGMVTLTAVVTTAKDKQPESGSDFNAVVTVGDGSATGPDDYSPSSSATLPFSPGDFSPATVGGESLYQARRTFTVRIENDNEDELDENFTARLAYETPGEPHRRGGNSTARVTITDDDPVPLALDWEQPVWSVEEADGTVTLKAVAITTINRMPEEGFSFNAMVNTQNGDARQPDDYSQLSVTETFLRSDFSSVTFDGQRRYRAEQEFTITIEADGNDEPNEDFSVRLGFAGATHPNLATGLTNATVWIIEDDAETADVQLTRNSSPGSVSQDATLTYEYTVKNNGPAAATGVTMIIVSDDNVRVDTADLPLECRHSGGSPGGEVNCNLGILADDETKDVSVEATVESVPNEGIVNWAYVTSSGADPTPGNNTYPATTGGGGGGGGTGGGFGGGGGGGPVNRAPVFSDTEGNVVTETTRVIAEDVALGTEVGAPVVATDPDEDTLSYTVSGDDATSFVVDASTGQLTTKTSLDHDTKASYTVTVTAADPSGATSDIQATITVTEVVFDCSSGDAVEDAADNPGLVADCEALLSSRDRLAGTATLNWSEDTLISEWDGVILGETPRRVTQLYLVRKGLDGTIPADLGSLSRLTGLYLHRNELTGPIPPQLGELSSLVHLTLHRNQLSGEIPPELGDLNSLVYLSLYGNELTGAIPAEMSGLSSLRWLYLHSNQSSNGGGLSGAIPGALGDLRNLERLMLYGNSLSGAIPAELGQLSALKSLLLHDNELTGRIPVELGNMSSLRYLWLDDNDLSGPIPAQLGDLSNLRWLSLYGNSLSGPIPAELGDLSALRLLILDRNDLSGAIPSELGELTELTWLDLNDNDLSGSIPSSLGDLSNLEHLYLHNNELTGGVPADLGGLTNLTNLWLRDNGLSGQIPPSLGELPNLQRVRIGGNDFTGCIPAELLGGPAWYSDAQELGLLACASDGGP